MKVRIIVLEEYLWDRRYLGGTDSVAKISSTQQH